MVPVESEAAMITMDLNETIRTVDELAKSEERDWRNFEEVISFILNAIAPDNVTLKELACFFNRVTGLDVTENSLCAPLALLCAKSLAAEESKRRCRVNGIKKKAWRANRSDAETND